MINKTWLVPVLLFAGVAFARSPEVYFTFDIQSRSEIARLTRILSIDDVRGLTVKAYANEKEFAEFAKLRIPYKILPYPSEQITPQMIDILSAKAPVWNAYPTYEAYEMFMRDYAKQYPNLCKLHDIGKTVRGRRLLFLKITAQPELSQDKPKVLYSSTMHGDETTGYALMLRMIDHLLSNYQKDPEITSLVDNVEIWINPLANPDGTYNRGNNTVQGSRRYNANSVDLNRNFPDPVAGNHPDGAAWQPETKAMMAFADAHQITLGANFHGGAEVVNYPWDSREKRHPDDAWFQLISRAYVDLIHRFFPTYMKDLSDGITNGFDWYEVDGGRQDFMTGFHHSREITLEVSATKLLDASQLPQHWDYNRSSLLALIEESLHGLRGIVKDQATQKPLAAKIEILDHDADNSFVETDPAVGDYHRPIVAGTYRVRVSANGYVPREFENVVVTRGLATRLDVELAKL